MEASSGSGEAARTTLTPATMTIAATRAPIVGVGAEHERDGDAREHAVGEGVAEEAHAPEHDPRADERRAAPRSAARPTGRSASPRLPRTARSTRPTGR